VQRAGAYVGTPAGLCCPTGLQARAEGATRARVRGGRTQRRQRAHRERQRPPTERRNKRVLENLGKTDPSTPRTSIVRKSPRIFLRQQPIETGQHWTRRRDNALHMYIPQKQCTSQCCNILVSTTAPCVKTKISDSQLARPVVGSWLQLACQDMYCTVL
jgi:hypothetical protein